MYVLCSIGLWIMAVMVLLSIIRAFITKWVLKWLGQSFEMLGGQDASMLYLHPTHQGNSEVIITTLTLLKGQLNFKSHRQQVQERVVDGRKWPNGPKRWPVLTRHIEKKFGYYVWVEDENFCLDNHVLLHPDSYTDEASLVKVLTSIVNRPFSKNQSPWEFVFIRKETAGAPTEGDETLVHDFAVVSRISHTMTDGFGFWNIHMALCEKASQDKLNEVKKCVMEKISKSSLMLQSNPFLHYLMTPSRKLSFADCCGIVLNALKILLSVPWYFIVPVMHQEHHSLHGPILSGKKLIAISNRVDFQIFKDIASAYHCSINTIFYCCLGGALQKSDPGATMFRSVVTTPVLPPGNRFSHNGSATFMVDLPLQMNSEQRIENYCRILNQSLQSPEPVVQTLVVNLIGNHLPPFLLQTMFNAPKYTVVTQNMRAAHFEALQYSCSMADIMLIPNNLQYSGVGGAILSYNGKTRFVVTVDEAVAPNKRIAQTLVEDCIQELNRLSFLARKIQNLGTM